MLMIVDNFFYTCDLLFNTTLNPSKARTGVHTSTRNVFASAVSMPIHMRTTGRAPVINTLVTNSGPIESCSEDRSDTAMKTAATSKVRNPNASLLNQTNLRRGTTSQKCRGCMWTRRIWYSISLFVDQTRTSTNQGSGCSITLNLLLSFGPFDPGKQASRKIGAAFDSCTSIRKPSKRSSTFFEARPSHHIAESDPPKSQQGSRGRFALRVSFLVIAMSPHLKYPLLHRRAISTAAIFQTELSLEAMKDTSRGGKGLGFLLSSFEGRSKHQNAKVGVRHRR